MKNKLITISIIAIIATLIIVAIAFRYDRSSEDAIEIFVDTPPEKKYLFDICIDSMDIDSCVVKNGESLSTILSKRNISNKQIYRISESLKGVFDVRNMRVAQPYLLLTPLNDSLSRPTHMVYSIDRVNHIVLNLSDSLHGKRVQKDVVTKTKNVTSTITNSFWNAVVSQGGRDELVARLENTYQWSVDFYGIRKGDGFNIIYDERIVDGDVIGVGDIKGAWFDHHGKRFYAIKYKDGNLNGYWDETGASLKKSFLKAPLRYSRISSGYSNSRLHPVLRVYRPHHGVDYAAPMGTPVEAIADGVITYKGYNGGAGHMIKMKHDMRNGRYSSGYLHLSRYGKGIKRGVRVKQGQVIGYVGSTGTSTGPHLDFRIWARGKAINPLKMNQEKGEPLKGEDLKKFMVIRDSVILELDNYYKQTMSTKDQI